MCCKDSCVLSDSIYSNENIKEVSYEVAPIQAIHRKILEWEFLQTVGISYWMWLRELCMGLLGTCTNFIQFALLISCSGLKWQGQKKQAIYFFSPHKWKSYKNYSKQMDLYICFICILYFQFVKNKNLFPKHRRKSVPLKYALVTLAVSCTEFLKNTNRGIQCQSDFNVIFVTY